ncbi:hypothetical protein Gotri_016378 [Gossypium trilobum]|uniref:Ribosomal protein L10e/L16 domain-containing protein n=1 Tax=Gossypium trilobum TaxID=34281 RepID=A0A7J9E3A6_9ROSI|nr:hypothetical protein [Gossypium trilobum]
MKGISYRGNQICFGRYTLQALEPTWITSRQIEAGCRAMTRNGKGSPDYWVAVVKLGRILYEMSGVAENIARMPISIAAHCNCRTAKAEKPKYTLRPYEYAIARVESQTCESLVINCRGLNEHFHGLRP